MKRSGCFAVGGLVLVAGCIFSLIIAVEFLRRRVEEVEESLGPQLATELVRVASLPPGSSLTIGDGQIEMAAFAPDGQTLVTATTRGLVFYDTADYRPRLSVPIEFGADALAWSPDGQALAVAGRWPALALFDAATGQLNRVLLEEERGLFIEDLRWSPDGRYLAAQGMQEVWIWDSGAGEQVARLRNDRFWRSPWAQGISWAPDSKRLAVSWWYGDASVSGPDLDELQVWEVGDKTRRVAKWPLSDLNKAQVAWTPDGRVLVNSLLSILAVDSADGRVVAQSQPGAPVGFLFALSPNGRTVVTDDDGTLHFYDAVTLDHMGQIQTALFGIDSLAWSPDGTSVAVTRRVSQAIQIWSWPEGRLLGEMMTENLGGRGLSWSPDSSLLAVAGFDGLAHVCDGQSGQCFLTVGRAEQVGVPAAVVWSPDGRMLATSTLDEKPEPNTFTTHIWSLTGDLLATLPGKTQPWTTGDQLITTNYDADYETWMQVWNVTANGQFVERPQLKSLWPSGVRSPDGKLIASIERFPRAEVGYDEGAKVAIVEAEDQSPVVELYEPGMSYVRVIAWSLDSAWLAATFDYECPTKCAAIQVWDTTTWQPHRRFGPLTSSAWSLSWSPDERWIAADESPTGQALTLYPLDEQQMIRELDQDVGADSYVAWSPDGRQIAITDPDGVVILWDAAALLPPPE